MAALRQSNFLLYSASRILSTLGQSTLQTVMAWQVYDMTGSPWSLGFLGLARFFPALASSVLGGLVADSFDRRGVMVASQSVPLAVGIVLAVATLGGWVSLPLILGLVVCLGLASSFEGPARTALLPAIVTPETFTNAVTVNNIFQKLGAVTGPTLSGFVIATLGIAAAYTGFCVATVLSVVPILLLRYAPRTWQGRKISFDAVREGVRFVRERPVLLGAMSLDMFAVIFGGASALLPIYARDILGGGAQTMGLLSSSMQAGAFLMSFVLVWRPPVKRTGRALILTVVAYGLVTVIFGLSREIWLSLFLYGLIGATDQISVVMRQTTIQMATPDELRGRVSSVHQVFVGASGQIGAMESGFVAALTSATFAVVSGGAGAVAVAAWMGIWNREMYRYEIQTHSQPITVQVSEAPGRATEAPADGTPAKEPSTSAT